MINFLPALFYHLGSGDLANQPIAPEENGLRVNEKHPLMGNVFIWNFQNVRTLEIFDKVDEWLARGKTAPRTNYIFPKEKLL